jgi:phospholipid transport system substrate-binding protein
MIMYRRKFLAFIASLSCLTKPAFAANDPGLQLVREFYNVLLQIMRAGPETEFRAQYELLSPAVDRTFDLPHILRISVGDYWARMPLHQQQALLTTFRAYTIASYVSSFESYGSCTVAISANTRNIGSEQIISTTVSQSDSDPLRLDYVVRENATNPRVVDVLLDGTISRVAVQRSDFSTLLTTGDSRRLIFALQKKVSALSRGAIAV